ncbi:hypothetical protein EMPG_10359 [Blastomyces silverae]|uniref:AT hook domain-containing protein n=1 Tax=Blastomyces silverae TaxID=2060906 RepID=A0A0H1B481_9EURO|nr:hypothetical protein EMPG_10359 [Blastomyces silverae]
MADAPLPRKRGRPPKLDATGNPVKKPAPPDGPPRKRGRPRKNPSELPTPVPTGPKRGRGRPRKDDPTAPSKKPRLSSDAPATTATTATPSKRGRPRKATTEAVSKAVNGTVESSSGFPLDKIIGIYSLECKEVEDNWPNEAEEMELTITRTSESPLGLIGGFNLGILEGTMLFAADKPTLDKFRAVMSKSGAASTPDEEAEMTGSENGGDIPHTAQSTPVKDRRVYFSWRGRSTSEGEIHSEEGTSSQDGYIDFTNNEAITFHGVAGFPALGSSCKFKGTKIDNDAADAPQPWTTFSRQAAEKAAVDRWG